MRVCHTVSEIREYVNDAKSAGQTVGLVPTMGYLHEGHLSLMREAANECDLVVISIFVNPTQFGPEEDFVSYPRDLDRDIKLAAGAGVNMVFNPDATEMYPEGFQTHIEVGRTSLGLCGGSRPGHFTGVATVVAKLFNIVQPDFAFFGWKDAQQLLVIQQMVRDLNMDLEVKGVRTVREKDGLAMSSRNVYLSSRERESATVIYRSLNAVRDAVANGERDVTRLVSLVKEMIKGEELAEIDYVEFRAIPEMSPLERIHGRVLLAVAVYYGKTRLIDNLVLEV
ncbi:MAG TPA: pantoate--beta-alanine ligase [Clostridia bacterium]|nr:pantoate--beta-alanine ligase [Clostridia bacterium]